MAVAEIIGAAIGVLLLVVVAYILVGGTISAAETLANAQKDLTLQQESRLRTHLEINTTGITTSPVLTFGIKNTGSETVGDFSHMTIFTTNSTKQWQYFTYDPANLGGTGNWSITGFGKTGGDVHPNELDPGEEMWVKAVYAGEPPLRFQITTANGYSAPWVV